jgi:hypothetical protein
MAYSDFTLSGITKKFNLTLNENTDLYANVAPLALRPTFQEQITHNIPLALRVSTEKARSEFLIAPILAELWRLTNQQVGVFSGVDFTVDMAQGLSGVCDYIITRSPELLFVKAPVVMLVEAKNEEMKKGYAQCIAEMIAAQTFNEQEESVTEKIYGVVTIGDKWKFLEMKEKTIWIDSKDYYLENLDHIMGILSHLVSLN